MGNRKLVINLFGGPGCGKSTTAAALFSELKKKGIKVEYIHEFAKELTYQERFKQLEDQGYIFAKQHHLLWSTIQHVDVVIMDSPLLLSLAYLQPNGVYKDEFKSFVKATFSSYNNLNIIVDRGIIPYQTFGRTQTESEAEALDSLIEELLKGYEYKKLNHKDIISEVEETLRLNETI